MSFAQGGQGGAGGRGCYNCGDPSHRAAECPTKGNPTCYNCGQQGHLSRECTQPQAEKSCYRCGETGHLSRECTKEGGAPGMQGGGQECYKCGERGHIARNCTQGGGGFGGQQGGYADKVRRVLEGTAVVRVVDVEPEQKTVEDPAAALEESMRALTLQRNSLATVQMQTGGKKDVAATNAGVDALTGVFSGLRLARTGTARS